MDQVHERVELMPVLVLNVNSRCNCRCVMCDIWKRESGTEMRVADLESHHAAWLRLSVRWVIFTGGEPLLHSDLHHLCALFRQDNIRLTLLTTGLLLNKRAAEVAELFDDIIVSLDGPAPVHDAIRRVNGAFGLIAKGVVAVRSFRPEMRISGRTTVQRANHRYLPETVASAKQIGFNSISFLAADVTSEAFNRPQQWTPARQSEIALAPDEVAELDKAMEQLIRTHADDIESGYIAESAAKLRRIVAHFRAYLNQSDEESPLCNAPWVSAVIETDGSVRPCFFHPAIGNINDAALDAVVNGEKAREFRRGLDIPNNSICRRCVCSLNCSSRKGS
jgi:MoaA/NifB/PqqE/SkfB family radical SAM enzyme